MEALMTRSVVL